MAKFHVTDEGNVLPCTAEVKSCRYGTHASTREEAQQKFEQAMGSSLPPKSENFLSTEAYRNVSKMPALFIIDREKHLTTEELNPAATWIFEEPARATRKRDGTSITVAPDGKIYARRSVKKGKQAPSGYLEAEVDAITGHSFGLEPLETSSFAKFVQKATDGKTLPPGTYELCGPKINGNPESLEQYRMIAHGEDEAEEIPPMQAVAKDEAFPILRKIFADYKARGIEGVVWHGKDGKRAKLRVKDFFGDENRS